MTRLGDQTLTDLLEELARPTPAPGGGSSAALTCAVAAALVEMAAGIGGIGAGRARAVRSEALALAEHELTAYAPVLEALRIPKDDPQRRARLEAALLDASRSPVEIAEAGAEVAEQGVEVIRTSSASVRGDARAAILLAEAAAAAAAGLVETNLAGRSEDGLLERARAASARARSARERA